VSNEFSDGKPMSNVSDPLMVSRRRVDPILQEVYDLKARLNAEAGYSVEKILARARASASANLSHASVGALSR
jgi:hypothetical protein